jgi:hypothetical protein
MKTSFTISVIMSLVIMVISAGCISPPQPFMNNLTNVTSNVPITVNDTGMNTPTLWNGSYTNTSLNGTLGMSGGYNPTHTNITVVAVGGGGGYSASGGVELLNTTAANEWAKKFGPNCTIIICGIWASYDTQGFYNQSGVYYSDGIPTGMTLEQMERTENTLANYRYNRYMNEKGYYYDGKKWHGNGL